MASKGITTTNNYRLFRSDSENRALDLNKHGNLRQSMKLYGFLRAFPIVCYRNETKQLVVKDGQHRLAIAEELGLPVHYVVEDQDFDIAVVNSTSKSWSLGDYAQKFAANGYEAYIEGMEFSEEHSIPVGIAFGLLAGTVSFNNIKSQFMSGKFEVKDRAYAELVAYTYSSICKLSKAVKRNSFLSAVMVVCRVEEFDPDRLIAGAARCRERLVAFSAKQPYLDLIEELYNYKRQYLVPIKTLAETTMRARSKKKT